MKHNSRFESAVQLKTRRHEYQYGNRMKKCIRTKRLRTRSQLETGFVPVPSYGAEQAPIAKRRGTLKVIVRGIHEVGLHWNPVAEVRHRKVRILGNAADPRAVHIHNAVGLPVEVRTQDLFPEVAGPSTRRLSQTKCQQVPWRETQWGCIVHQCNTKNIEYSNILLYDHVHN